MNNREMRKIDWVLVRRIGLLFLLLVMVILVYFYYRERSLLNVEIVRLNNKINELKSMSYLAVDDSGNEAYGMNLISDDGNFGYRSYQDQNNNCVFDEVDIILNNYELPENIEIFRSSFGNDICWRNYLGINEICTEQFGCDPAASITYQIILIDKKINLEKIIRIKRDMGILHLK